MFTPYAELEVRRVAQASGLDPAAALALASAASGGQALVHAHGRTEPSIAFHPHVFHRRLRPEARPAAMLAGLACRRPGELRAPAAQRARHALFARARMIDREAAYAACAWGIGRVPGEMARALGFENAEALADEARSGVAGQARLMLRMIEARGLGPAFRARDWAALAGALDPAEAGLRAAEMARAYARWRGAPPRAAARAPELFALADAFQASARALFRVAAKAAAFAM